MLLRISAFSSPHIQGTILALKGMDKELSAQIRKATKSVTVDEWRRFLALNAHTPLERAVMVSSARVAVSNTNVSLRSGQLSKKLAGGGRISDLTPAVEFGANPNRVIESHSRAGRAYKRKVGTAFKGRNPTGYVAYPAAADAIPRIASMWVATVVRTFHEALDDGVS